MPGMSDGIHLAQELQEQISQTNEDLNNIQAATTSSKTRLREIFANQLVKAHNTIIAHNNSPFPLADVKHLRR